MTRRYLFLSILLALGLVAKAASAQERFNLQSFRPTPTQRMGIFTTHGARLLTPVDFDLHLMGSLGWSPWAIETGDGDTMGKIVSSITAGNLLFAIGVHERFEIGLDLPILRTQEGDGVQGFREAPLGETVIGFGDIRLVPRVLLYSTFSDRTDNSGIALTLVADASIPSGDQQAYAGDGGVRLDPRVAFDVGLEGGHLIAINAGYSIRPETEIETLEVDDFIALSVGGDVHIIEEVHVLAEISAALTPADDLGAEEVPVELLGAGRFLFRPFVFQAGAGMGLSNGAGPTDWRFFGSVGYEFDRDETDRDDDSLVYRDDACPNDAEDPDGFDDADGCPDDDNDADGIVDIRDACPNEPEDFDNVADFDGCPEVDADSDGDRIADLEDICPNEAEDLDGYQDSDGCPDDDNDGDGVSDTVDRCPDAAGVIYGCPVVESVTVRFLATSTQLDDNAIAILEQFVRDWSLGQPEGAMVVLRAAVLAETDTDDAAHQCEFLLSTDQLDPADEVVITTMNRAESVAAYLTQQGIAAEQLVTNVFDCSEMTRTAEDEVNRVASHRVEVRVVIP